jgi:hypothetical protein
MPKSYSVDFRGGVINEVGTDKPTAIMRTALRADASKINRKALGPVGGAVIKLSAAAEAMTGLAIGEGLESTLAGMAFGLRPAWALGSLWSNQEISAARRYRDADDPWRERRQPR